MNRFITIRGALDAILLAHPTIAWSHKDTLNTGVKPDGSTGYFELEFPGGNEDQLTFGASGFDDWQQIGEITVRAVVRRNPGKEQRDQAETFIETIRSAFRGRRIPIGSRVIRIVRTDATGGGQDEAGMWLESLCLEYRRFNVASLLLTC